MPFETPHDGAGTVLTFNSVTYTVTNVVVSAVLSAQRQGES